MGMFLGALDNPIMQEEMTTRQQIAYQAKQMGRRSWSSCKTFAVMGLVFSAAECTVEKVRAKHDMTNTAVAGCITGGTLSARGGPKAACAGCAGFATFSVLIENSKVSTLPRSLADLCFSSDGQRIYWWEVSDILCNECWKFSGLPWLTSFPIVHTLVQIGKPLEAALVDDDYSGDFLLAMRH
ncbi:hypothetical protein HAX54_029214 [Datura stramonium]|uniref:Mitochondrial import inner membrane translocase subunit TIM22 n=1 Tax=Datura stramonium TaxID=4076 RepID=A0ABS8V5W9_DATST|nr:hypothetical protein [Datura stramonium]